ncbi:Signal transduction histidine kinase [Desulfocicer vacuolatum DSM 3385]|uniref:histidine kinase n=2 Tax=Desulfocicer vacuolatum TaxID=2298 RepID=A0A1W2CAG7_9BACT|nr:Signal transduction histidine kinase [Desulfocicer vacuolatum DSM 3385]
MMKPFTFKRIQNRLVFWFFILGLTPLLIGIITTYRLQVASMEKETFQKLVAIRDLKAQRLEKWLYERMADLKTVSTANELLELEQIMPRKQKSPRDMNIYKSIRRLMTRYLDNYDAYEELFILNPRTGIVEVSTNQSAQGMDKSNDPYFTRPMKSKKIFIKDIYYSKFFGKMIMTFSIPIFCSTHNRKHTIGIMVARMDLKNSLYTLLQDKTGLGNTGETLIVNKEVKALNELRWYPNAPLNLQIKAAPAINAARGKTGMIESMDYRGENVLAAYTHIPQTNWGFICKQDVHELKAPIRKLLGYYMALCVFSTLAILMIALWLSKLISRPIVEMGMSTRKIIEGDYSVRNQIHSRDELGSLARFINEMADSIAFRMAVQQNVLNISETMTALSSMEIFASKLLSALMENTHSNMGVFYTFNKKKEAFEHTASMGFNENILKSFDGKNPPGELGRAAVTGQIHHIKNIPGDTVFKFKTVAGDAVPREILTIPITMEQEVTAIISLVNLNTYTRESLEVVNQSWNLINASHAHLSAGIKTKTLAKDLKTSNKTLEAQKEELQVQSQELKNTAEELQEQNIELETQRRQVEEANRLKSEFLSNMSHELRTPLNSVMALSRVLAMQAGEKLSREEISYLEIIERNGKNLLALINDILDLSKIEAGRMDITSQSFQITSTIDTIVERLTPIAREKNIELRVKVPPKIPRINSDENRIHQILQNLISNAVKFTKQGYVSVSIEQNGEKIHVAVSDTGIGIDKKDLPHIFKEFRQVDGTSSRSYEGTGLGLAIAFKAARMLGGDITVQSAPDQGSTFTLTLPLQYQESMCPPLPQPIQRQAAPEPGPTGKTILVVDDEPDSLAMISNYLSKEGYNVITSTSGYEAIQLAKSHHPFAITLDVIMPEMDGFEVLQNLKQSPETRDIPVIMVSISDDKETGMALGAVGYISKPVNKDLLISEINRLCGPWAHSILIADDNEIELKDINGHGKILMVEDNEAAILQVKMFLETEGYIVDIARGGQEALEYMAQTIPDGIILDLMMPKIDGFQVLEKMRSTKNTSEIPVLILTARDLTPEDLSHLSANNVQQLIQKGDIDPHGLLTKVQSMLGESMKMETPDNKIHDQKEKQTLPVPGELTTEITETQTKNPNIEIFAPPKKSLHKSTLLVVEDNPDNMITIKAILQNKYTILEATDGKKGLHMALTRQPDLILLDISLPEMDGFSVVKRVKQNKETAHIPVIALTAHAMKGDKIKIIDAGCDDYLSKPINPEQIKIAIRNWLQK